ncbi:MAG TPA: hypothetical protein VJN48_09870 [Terriglobales bacterium]|nr:hypothetical protein [Terriglobales bacterium]
MKTFFVGLALGFGIGFLLLPKSGNEHEELRREKTRELQRSLPQDQERILQSAAVREHDRYTHPPRPEYESRGGAVRTGIHPVALLNMATEKELVAAGVDPGQASKIIARRPYISLQDAMDRGLLSLGTLTDIQKAAAAHEPIPLQPLA